MKKLKIIMMAPWWILMLNYGITMEEKQKKIVEIKPFKDKRSNKNNRFIMEKNLNLSSVVKEKETNTIKMIGQQQVKKK
jgi:hypothetical protein